LNYFIDSTSTQSTGLTDSSLRATPAMVRFSKVMHQQREVHPTIVLTLEGIVDQVNFSIITLCIKYTIIHVLFCSLNFRF